MTTTSSHTMFLVLVAVVLVCLYVPGIYALQPQISHQSRFSMSTVNRHSSLHHNSLSSPITTSSSRRKHSHIFMAARSGGGGSTKIDRKVSQQTSTKPSYREEIEKDWRLILHDDTVHTIQQVGDFNDSTSSLTDLFSLALFNFSFTHFIKYVKASLLAVLSLSNLHTTYSYTTCSCKCLRYSPACLLTLTHH